MSILADRELEMGVLNSFATSRAFRERCGARPEWFTSADLLAAFAALQRLCEADEAIHIHSLRQALSAVGYRGRTEDLCSQVCSRVPAHQQVDSRAAQRLGRLARLRRLREATAAVFDATGQEDLGKAQEAVARLLEASTLEAACLDLSAYDSAGHAMAPVMASVTPIHRVDPVLPKLRWALGYRIPAGNLTVVGAATNVGKSQFVLAWLVAMAEAGTPVGYVSCEDGPAIVGSRLLASRGVDARLLTDKPTLDLREQERFDRAYRALHGLPLRIAYLDREEELDDLAVTAAMSRLVAQGARFIAVDYVQALASHAQQQDRRNEVRTMAKRIKARGVTLGVPVVLVSQLRRPSERANAGPPSKHDLKEAGDLENCAEQVILLWRDVEDDWAPVHAKLVKSKTGGVGRSWDLARDEVGWLRESQRGA